MEAYKRYLNTMESYLLDLTNYLIPSLWKYLT